MKLAAGKVAAYVQGFGKSADRPAAILLYGRDLGAVREYAKTIEETFLGAEPDPLQRCVLSGSQLSENLGLLAEEAAAIPMFGGDKCVNVRLQGTSGVKSVIEYVDAPVDAALVIIEAGMLTPSNALRKAFEGDERCMALPCFEDDPAQLAANIQDFLAREGFKIDAQALDHLRNMMGADRGVTQRELERLVLFLGPGAGADGNPQLVTYEDVLAAMGDTAAASLDALVDAVALGDAKTADLALARLAETGTPPPAAVISLRRHLQTLHLVLGQVERGAPPDKALLAFKPPLHFKRRDRVMQQLRQWTRRKAEMALGILHETEAACRQSQAPADTLAAYAILRITRGARAQTPRG